MAESCCIRFGVKETDLGDFEQKFASFHTLFFARAHLPDCHVYINPTLLQNL